jgi:hypothetical protein
MRRLLLLTLPALLLSLGSCSVSSKERANPLDPSGANFSNSSIGFPTTNLTFTDGTGIYPFADNATMTWPKTTGITLSNYAIYYSFNNSTFTNATRIYSNIASTVQQTNIKFKNGPNYWWIEAMGINGKTAYLSNYYNMTASGFRMDYNAGSSGTSSLVCADVPLGASRTVTIQAGNTGTPTASATSIAYALRVYPGSSGLSYRIIFSNYAAGASVQGTLLVTTQPYSFSNYSFTVSPGAATASQLCYWIIIVSNMSDEDGMNGLWFDDLNPVNMTGTGQSGFPVDFASQPPGFTGDLGNW